MADMSFCDFWNADEIKREKEGNSCVILRNETAMQIFKEMQEQNYIALVQELSEQDVINTQLSVVKAKKGKIREQKAYQNFFKVSDFVLKYRLYRFFGIRLYSKFCGYYGKLCKDESIL